MIVAVAQYPIEHSVAVRRRKALEATEYRYTVVFEPAEEGGYVVTVPILPGLVTEGDTLEEARAMAKDAILGYLESLRKHGEEIPIERGEPITERILVSLSIA
jgi:predicted RNase H-like HicB family nuclease